MTIYVFLMYGKSVRDQLLSLPGLSKFCEDHKFYPVAGDEFNYSELSEEDKRNLLDTLALLNRVAIEWNSVPNFDGEEQFRKKAKFNVLLDDWERAKADLELANIGHDA